MYMNSLSAIHSIRDKCKGVSGALTRFSLSAILFLLKNAGYSLGAETSLLSPCAHTATVHYTIELHLDVTRYST